MFGVVWWEALEKGRTVNGAHYAWQLEQVKAAWFATRPAHLTKNGMILLHDNASPHRSKSAKKAIRQLRIDALPHPAYSPDLAPTDFHLFRSLEHWLRGKNFTTAAQAIASVQAFFASKDAAFFEHGIRALPERWEMALDSCGHYFEI